MSSAAIPKSVRLQKRVREEKDPATKSKENKFYLVWFPEDLKYSLVEGKSIKESQPKAKDKVHVKDSSGTWEGIVYASGSESSCKEKQMKLEELCQSFSNINDNEDSSNEEEWNPITVTMKRKGSAGEKQKGKKKARVGSESDENDETSKTSPEFNLIRKESSRVNKLLNSKEDANKGILNSPERSEELIFGLYRRLDTIIDILGRIADRKDARDATSVITCSSPTQPRVKSGNLTSSPSRGQASTGQEVVAIISEDYTNDPEFTVGGINLISDVTVKTKKPTLYATALMAYLFTDEEMREGCVEPKENALSKKKALDQAKINLIKRCIKIKFSEKTVEKCWSDIRTSMNQKCLDKLKIFRRVSADS